MLQKINELRKASQLLDPNADLREVWTEAVIEYAESFLNQIDQIPTYQAPSEGESLILNFPFKEDSIPIGEILNTLEQEVDQTGINPAGPGHLGYVPGGGIYPTALGDYLAAVTNRYSGIFFANPGAVRMENALVRWMCQLIGYPVSSLGNLTSGGSIANLIGVVAARDAKEVSPDRISRSVIYMSPQVHHCVYKAIRIAGLSECITRHIAMDGRFRMNIEQLEHQIRLDIKASLNPFMIIGSAGTTDTGAIDPLDKMAEVAEKYQCWYHVDAAYGGFFTLVQGMKDKFLGLERADSVVLDPHKGMFLSYGIGAVLVKDPQTVYKSHYYRANYMQDAYEVGSEPNPSDLSPELTKHFRGLRMWFGIHLFGLKPFRAALEEKIMLCRYFWQEVQSHGFITGCEPELSTCIFRYEPPFGESEKFNRQILDKFLKDGRIFFSSTTINGIFWLRICVMLFRTHLEHIKLALDLLEQFRDELLLEVSFHAPERI